MISVSLFHPDSHSSSSPCLISFERNLHFLAISSAISAMVLSLKISNILTSTPVSLNIQFLVPTATSESTPYALADFLVSRSPGSMFIDLAKRVIRPSRMMDDASEREAEDERSSCMERMSPSVDEGMRSSLLMMDMRASRYQ